MNWDLLFQILASVMTIASYWFMGNKSLWGPLWGLMSQSVMFVVIVLSGTYGLLLALAIISAVHLRTLVRWTRERAEAGAD
jgi:hypothetical protein